MVILVVKYCHSLFYIFTIRKRFRHLWEPSRRAELQPERAAAEFIVSYFASNSVPEQKPETSTNNTTAGIYTVVKGDTLSQIGAKLGMKWQDIAAANNIKAPYTIYTGQKLVIPAASQPSEHIVSTYTVKKGDTLSKISAALGVDWKAIAAANGIKSPYTIYVNQKLTIQNK